MKRIYPIDILSILLLLLFLYTATSKFLDYDRFVFQMQLAPVVYVRMLAPTIGWLMPAIEVGLCALLCYGIFHPLIQVVGLYGALFLLIAFQVYITAMLLSGLNLPCTCGGIISGMRWWQHLVFNGLLILLILITLWKRKPIN